MVRGLEKGVTGKLLARNKEDETALVQVIDPFTLQSRHPTIGAAARVGRGVRVDGAESLLDEHRADREEVRS